jgi:hypothetical protein
LTFVATAEDLAENIKCHECLICGYRRVGTKPP